MEGKQTTENRTLSKEAIPTRGWLRKGEGRRAPELSARVPSMLLVSLCLVWCARAAP